MDTTISEETFILIDERWLRTNMTDALGLVHDCYVRQVLDDGHIQLLGVPTKSYKVYG